VPTQSITKPANIDYFRVPRPLWRKLKPLLPKAPDKRTRGPGRPPAETRAVLNGIWYVLWTGCQWKAIHRDWFGVASSVLHERFQTWQREGRFAKILKVLVRFYARSRRIKWTWQSIDSRSSAAPLGGEATGKNPTDRGKRGSKLHLLVDQRGAPLAVHITGANTHDKCVIRSVVLAVVVGRPSKQQHLCADRGYDYADVHEFVLEEGYIPHIKHRRRRGEPPAPKGDVPGEAGFPARRWVVERTFSWLLKRRSIRTRWCKKAENWLALVQFACAHILCDMAIYG
jgi:putative transposase